MRRSEEVSGIVHAEGSDGRRELAAPPAMSLCALCGGPSFRTDALCSHHLHAGDDDWATSNRVMCDFIHRGIVLRTLAESYLSQAD